jgi:CelD/BcsL family acetyltransferase involved in cellulose biosynthesis
VIVERVPTLDAARAEWSALADAGGNLFGTWEWARAWWDIYGDDERLHLHVVRDPSGAARAILPLYAWRHGPMPIARFIGHGAADELGPVCAPADRPLAARALRHALARSLGRGAVVYAERLPGAQGWPDLLGTRAVRRESTPALAIEGRTWDEWLASRSRNFREQVRRRERKLGREHDLAFRRVDDPDALDEAMDVLFALHDARWGEASGAFTPERRVLHLAFARRALERGWLRLWFADLDGRPAAAWLGFRFADALWYYQAGRDPAHERANVGFVLLSHTIRTAFEDELAEYRFLLGDEPYKERFASHDPGLDTLVAGARPLAAAAPFAADAVRRSKTVRRALGARLRHVP